MEKVFVAVLKNSLFVLKRFFMLILFLLGMNILAQSQNTFAGFSAWGTRFWGVFGQNIACEYPGERTVPYLKYNMLPFSFTTFKYLHIQSGKPNYAYVMNSYNWSADKMNLIPAVRLGTDYCRISYIRFGKSEINDVFPLWTENGRNKQNKDEKASAVGNEGLPIDNGFYLSLIFIIFYFVIVFIFRKLGRLE